jgi:hypothetical protein
MKTMRKGRALAAGLLLAAATAACGDAYEKLFLDPERATSAEIEYLFTQVLTGAELQIGYWEGYYRIYRNIARWGQLTGTVNEDRMMNMDATQWGDYWRHYYTERSMWNLEMNEIYETLPDEARAGNEVYLHLGRIIHAFQTSRMTDLWGDLPYSQALQGDDGVWSPAYDTQQQVYDGIFADLDRPDIPFNAECHLVRLEQIDQWLLSWFPILRSFGGTAVIVMAAPRSRAKCSVDPSERVSSSG